MVQIYCLRIACTEGIDFVQREEPQAIIWCGAIDEELTAKGYIVPGLGDAGDLAYGTRNPRCRNLKPYLTVVYGQA